ncbi:MAG: OmpH family outer membrane protein [Bacteroidota bacterium]
MTKTTKIILAAGFGVLMLGSLIANLTLYRQIPKAAYVDIHRVFGEFHGKQELEARLKKNEFERKAVLDSASLQLKVLTSRAQEQPKNHAMLVKLQEEQAAFSALSSEIIGEQEKEDQEYTQKAWGQINQYVIEYGQEKGLGFIYGVNGSGSMMYADQAYDITEEVIVYINNKYEGY